MTNNELLNFSEKLNKLNNLKGIKIAYTVAKNKKIIADEVKSLQASIIPTDAFDTYEKERVALAKQYAEKDEKGKPKQEGDKFIITDKEFDVQLEALKEKHKDAIEERQKQIDAFNEFLKEETKIELHKIKMKDLPEDISVEQLSSIYEIIEE